MGVLCPYRRGVFSDALYKNIFRAPTSGAEEGHGMELTNNRYSTDLTSPAKPAVDENCDMAGQIHALAIVVQHQKSQELTAAYGL